MIRKRDTDGVFVDALWMGFGLELFKAVLSAVEVDVAENVGILIAFEPAFGPIKTACNGVDRVGFGEV